MDRACAKCGYLLQAWETTCPRCARRANTPCELCGRIGVVGECDRCHRDLCEVCAIRGEDHILCAQCREQAAEAVPQQEELRAAHQRRAAVSAPAAGPFPLGMRHSTGLWDSILRAFVFIGQSMSMCFRDKDLILPSAFSLLANGAFLGIVLGLLWAAGLLDQITGEGKEGAWLGAVIGVLLGFCIYLISYFFTAMTVHLIDTHLKGEDAQLKSAFADASKNLFALISLAVVSTLVAIITSALRRRGRGGPGEFVAAAVNKLWTVATFVLLPIIILEDVSLGKGLERARSLHGRNLIPIAVGEIAVSLVTGALGFAVVLLAAAAVFSLVSLLGPAALIPGLVAAAVIFAGVVAFSHYLRTAYYTCLYLWAAAREHAGDMAPAPAPLAAALS